MAGQLASILAQSEPISNLNDQLPVSPAVSLDDFVRECSDLIDGVDPRDHPFPEERSIRFPRSKLTVTPFQLYEGWRMLNQREKTGLRGGLQASSAGVGKTFFVLVMVLLRARMFESERIVKEFWSTSTSSSPARGPRGGPRTDQHLPPTARGNGLRCPSQKQSDIICYCVPTSKARGFIESGIAPSGVSLIQAPGPVVEQWISVFRDVVLDPSAYNLVIVYPEVPIGLKRDYARITNSISQPGARGRDPLYAPETYIFCSSHLNPKVHDTFTSGGISVGLMVSDESHKAMTLSSRSMAIAQAQTSVGDGVDLWLVSATPIRLLPDFELPVRIFSNSSHLARAKSMENMVTAYGTARSSDEDMAAFWEHWSKVFDSKLVLRNTVTSQFRGRPITNLQVVEPDQVLVNTPEEHFKYVQEVAYLARQVIRDRAKVAEENEEVFRPDYPSDIDPRLHFVSLFPAAAAILIQNGLDVREESITRKIGEIKISNKLKVENIESYQRLVEKVSHGSPKLGYILEEIGRMRSDGEQRQGDPDTQSSLRRENLSMKKMVIITPTLGTAVFLYLFLLKRVPKLNPVCFHAAALPKDREAALASFQSITARANAKHSYILITPFATAGTGLNLQSANYQILVYPPSTRNSQTQAFARTNRTGQRLTLHHTVLISQDNPADRINVVNSAGRTIRSDPFEMRRHLVLHELDGSKKIQMMEDWGYEFDEFDGQDTAEYFVLHNFPGVEVSQVQFCRVGFLPDVPRMGEYSYFNPGTSAFGTFCVHEAWNDEDARPRHEKLNLRDMIADIWIGHLGRAGRDLTTIMYCIVIEENLSRAVRRHVYILMTEEITRNLVIRRNGGSPQETEAFIYMLRKAPFCAGAQKMLDEYPEFAGIQVESFEFDVPNKDAISPFSRGPPFNFKVHFGRK